jgi:predicted transposase/invertase (TIGR01784 family)
MSNIRNPHDRFARELLSRQEVAADFLENYLPAEIATELDLSRLSLLNDSFVDDELREHLSDLLYRIGLKTGGEGYLYILVEHKSDFEKWAGVQWLRYLG